MHRRHLPRRPFLIGAAVLALVSAGTALGGAPDGWRAGQDPRRPLPLSAADAAQARARAAALGRALGLAGQPEDPARELDRFAGREIDSTALSDHGRRTAVMIHDVASGRVRAVANLAWRPEDDRPLLDRAGVAVAARGLAAAAGVRAPAAAPAIQWDEASDAWEARWPRIVEGVPIPSNDLVVRVRRSGQLASLSAPESPLAAAPPSRIPAARAEAVARAFATTHGLERLGKLTVSAQGLAWVEANAYVDPGAADAPDPTLRLCQVVRLTLPPAADGPRLIELYVDAGSGDIVGGDQTG